MIRSPLDTVIVTIKDSSKFLNLDENKNKKRIRNEMLPELEECLYIWLCSKTALNIVFRYFRNFFKISHFYELSIIRKRLILPTFKNPELKRRQEEEKLKEDEKDKLKSEKLKIWRRGLEREILNAGKIKLREEKKKKEPKKKAVKKVSRTLQESDCNVCGILYQDEEEVEKAKWIPCEKCNNWVCSNCLPPSFHLSDDYSCKDCTN